MSQVDADSLSLYIPSTPAYQVPHDAPSGYENSLLHMGAELRSDSFISALFGIEADNPPDPDSTYWRMGYRYPIQLTNWALAMAPQHAVAHEFLSSLAENITKNHDSLQMIVPLE